MSRPTVTVRTLAFDKCHGRNNRSLEFGCTLEGVSDRSGSDYHGGVIILREIEGGSLGHKLRVDLASLDPGVLVVVDPKFLAEEVKEQIRKGS